MSGLNVIELGAGTGLAGLVCAKLGARVVITDKPFVLPLIAANTLLNIKAQSDGGEAWGEALQWGQKLPKRLKRRDNHLIVASDVVGCGDEALYPPLIKTLVELSFSSGAAILMSYKPRARFERIFFESAREHFAGRREFSHPCYARAYPHPAADGLHLSATPPFPRVRTHCCHPLHFLSALGAVFSHASTVKMLPSPHPDSGDTHRGLACTRAVGRVARASLPPTIGLEIFSSGTLFC